MNRWLTSRRLHALQQRYYTGDETSIPEYFAALAEARSQHLAEVNLARRPIALHLGSGAYHIPSWINVDLSLADHPNLVTDLARALPFKTDSIDYIHSEDFLEHITLEAGRQFLRECFRVLQRGGILRLLTPDLRALVRRVYLRGETAHIRWCNHFFGDSTRAEALNTHLRMGGDHRFVYDAPLLQKELTTAGFSVRSVTYNKSKDPFLEYLDIRDFGLNLFFEAVKPVD